MKKLQLIVLVLGGILCLWSCEAPQKEAKLTFTVGLADSLAEEAQTGRLILMLSKDGEKEPRFSLSDGLGTQQGFGKDVEGFGKGATVTFGAEEFGYPIESLSDVPAGKYYVQAVLNRYQ